MRSSGVDLRMGRPCVEFEMDADDSSVTERKVLEKLRKMGPRTEHNLRVG